VARVKSDLFRWTSIVGLDGRGVLGSRTEKTLLASGDRRSQRFGTIAAVTLRPLYLTFQQMLGQILLMSRSNA
jgi:hypothetical protein